jgi:hypothetical protein
LASFEQVLEAVEAQPEWRLWSAVTKHAAGLQNRFDILKRRFFSIGLYGRE